MLICDILVSAYFAVLSEIRKLYSCLIRNMVMLQCFKVESALK